jgi:tyrosine-protein phosphatase YwqE
MKVDIHSHILPDIDDGARTLEESVQLVTEMAGWGFERITCTPHITKKFRNTNESIREKFDILCNAIADKGLGVEITMSAEYRLNPETWPDILEGNKLMPIEDRYLLMEFPIKDSSEMGDLIPMEEFRKVISLGLTPVLPHPERYFYLDRDELLRYVDEGVLIQSNYGSLAGVYGMEVRDRAQSLIDEGLVSFLASDMHNMDYIRTISAWLQSGNTLWDI